MNTLGLLLFGVWNFTACGYERLQKRLDNQEFDHYYALRVYMSEEQRKYYLKLKTRDERDAYLKKLGLWDTFYSYEPEEREEIVAGDVKSVGLRKRWRWLGERRIRERKRLVEQQVVRKSTFIDLNSNRMVRSWCGNQTVKQCTRLFACLSERLSSMTMW